MQVHSPATLVTLAAVTSAAGYTTGKIIGTPQKLSNVFHSDKGQATLTSLCLIDSDKQSSSMDLLFFSSNPSAQTDGASEATSAADIKAKLIGVVKVLNSDFVTLANSSVVTLKQIGLKVQGELRSKDLYVLLVCRGSPTYTSTNSLTLKLGFDQN